MKNDSQLMNDEIVGAEQGNNPSGKVVYRPPARRKAAFTIASGGYAIRIITIVQTLVLTPMYLHFIGAGMYGYWLASGGILAWLSILDFGVAGIIKQRCAQNYGAGKFQETCAYFSHGIVVYSVISILFIFVAIIFSFFLGSLFRIPTETQHTIKIAFILAAIGLSLSTVRSSVYSFTYALQMPALGIWTAVATQLIYFGVGFIMILKGFGLYSLPCALILRDILTVGIVGTQSFYLFKKLGGKFAYNAAVAHDYFRISPMLVLAKIGTQSANQLEPTLITMFLIPELATAYVITKKAGEMLQSFLNGIQEAIGPGFAHVWGQGLKAKAQEIYKISIDLFWWGNVIALCVYLATNKSFISIWTKPDYFIGMNITVLIAGSILAAGIANITGEIFSATGSLVAASKATLITGLANLALMALLLKLFGIIGLPIAGLTTGSILAIYYLASNEKRIGFKKGFLSIFSFRHFVGCLALAGAAAIGYNFTMQTLVQLSILASAVFAVCIAIGIAISPSIKQELNKIKPAWFFR